MTGAEGLAQLVQSGVFAEDLVADLLRLVDDVEARVNRGELTDAQGAAILDAHAERAVAHRKRTAGPFSAQENELAQAVALALDAQGPPS